MFLNSFITDRSKPIHKKLQYHIEYVPTQIVCKYLRCILTGRNGSKIDRIIYPSSKSNKGKCCSLFIKNEDCTEEKNDKSKVLWLDEDSLRIYKNNEGDDYMIHPSAKLGQNVTIKEGTIIGENVTIEDNVYIDYGCIIRDNVHIKKGSFIGARTILGEYLMDFYKDKINKVHPLVIGENALIRTENVIYGDTVIGEKFQSGHKVTIREGTNIGNNVRIGTLSDIQGHCDIGNYIGIHSNVHIGQKSKINDYVWIFPYVILTNDPTPPSDVLMGVTIDSFAIIATGSILLPGVHISEDALVGAGAIVNRDVPKETVVVGNPAKEMCSVRKIKSKVTGESVYPWRYAFKRGMPWEESDYETWYNSLNIKGDE